MINKSSVKKLRPIPQQEYYELSDPQRNLWTLSQLNGTSHICNTSFSLRIEGSINIECFKCSLESLVNRHESLRTIFIEVDGKPWQKILSGLEVSHFFCLTDLRDDLLAEKKVEEILKESLWITFDLSSTPLFRINLIQLSDNTYLLLFNLHQIICDGWSTDVIIKDLLILYNAYLKGSENPLKALKVQYKDYAAWYNSQYNSEHLKKQQIYWRKQFEGEIPTLNIATDKPRSKIQTYKGGQISFEMSKSLTKKIKDFCLKEDITLFIALLAFIKTLLYRYTEQKEIIIGVPISGRGHAELDEQVGFYANTLALRTSFEDSMSFRELIQEVKTTTLSAYEHQSYGFDKLVEDLNIERDLSHNPLFDFMVMLHNSDIDISLMQSIRNLEIKRHSSFRIVKNIDLFFCFMEKCDNLHCEIEFNADLYDAIRIQRIFMHFQNIITHCVNNPNVYVDGFDILTLDERKDILCKFNDSKKDFPINTTIVDLFKQQVNKTPQNVAMCHQGCKMSYGELNLLSTNLANYLIELGVKEGSRVAIYMNRSFNTIEALYGILKTGAAYVPLDIRWPEERLNYLLLDLGVEVVISQNEKLTTLNKIIWNSKIKHIICLDVVDELIPQESLDKETVASLWDFKSEIANDMISAGGFYSIYSGEKFSEEEVREYQERIIDIIKRDLKPNSRIMDIGCGSGLIMFEIASLVDCYIGIDPSKKTQQKNKAYIDLNNITNIKLITAFADDIKNIQEGEFDIIILSSVVQFFPGIFYLEKIVNDLFRVLRPNGTIIIADIPDLAQKNDLIESVKLKNGNKLPHKSLEIINSTLHIHEDFWSYICSKLNATAKILKRTLGFNNELHYRYDVIIKNSKTSGLLSNQSLAFHTRFHVNKNPKVETPISIGENSLAYIIFTSGSTGIPNGVEVCHRAVVNLIDWVNKTFYINANDKLLFVTSLCFDLSIYDIFGILASGGSIFIPTEEELLNPCKLAHILNEEQITFWDSAPAFLEQILLFVKEENVSSNYLRLVFASGDWIPMGMFNDVKSHFPYAEFVSLGGATEATVWSNYFVVKKIMPNWKSIPYGKPIQNSKYYILDKKLNVCPIGIAGDLYISGICLAEGYFNNKTLTSERFIPNPYSSSDDDKIIYYTGDMARFFEDGNIEFLGRKDNQIKLRGYRIELGEIENVINKISAIDFVVVVKKTIAEQEALCAYIKRATEDIDADCIKSILIEKLPYYMVPTYYTFIDTVPITTNGKLNKKALPEPKILTKGSIVLPSNNIEMKLINIWSDILKIEVENICVNDKFFDLGGNSLTAIKLCHLISKKMFYKIDVRDIFLYETISKLSKLLLNKEHSEYDNIKQAPKQDYYVTTPMQKRLWLASQKNETQRAYNIAMAYNIEGFLDIEAFEVAVEKLIDRHEILRTVFVNNNGQLFQKTIDVKSFNDYYYYYMVDNQDHVCEIISEHQNKLFNLEIAPLFKAILIKKSQHEYILSFIVHHILFDGWSAEVLLNEIFSLYVNKDIAATNNIQYKDYSVWINNKFKNGDYDKYYSFWRNQLFELPQLDLPVLPTNSKTSYNGSELHYDFNLDFSLKFISLNIDKSSLLTNILSIIYILLHKYTHQDNIVIGTTFTGRNIDEVTSQIGPYLNTCPLKCNVKKDSTFKLFHEQIKSLVTTALDAQFYPFEEILQEKEIQNSIASNNLFNVLVELQSFNQPELSNLVDNIEYLNVKTFNVPAKSSRVDLNLMFFHKNDSLSVTIEYNTDLYREKQILNIIKHFEFLSDQILSNPNKIIKDYSLLLPSEQLLLDQMNNTDCEFPHTMVYEYISEYSKNTPEKIAILSNDISISYLQLESYINLLAYELINHQVNNGDIVAVLMNRSEKIPISILSIWKTNTVYLPIDPNFPKNRIEAILDDSHAKILIIDHQILKDKKNNLNSLSIPVINVDDVLLKQATKIDLIENKCADINQLAYVIYTSGSTGTPKGVMVEHIGMINHLFIKINDLRMTSNTIIAQNSSQCFDISIWQFFASLMVGGTVVIYGSDEINDPNKFISKLIEDRVTILEIVPSYLSIMLNYFEKDNALQSAFTLKYLLVTGEALKPHLVKKWFEIFPEITLLNAYGPTEASDDITHHCMTEYPQNGIIPIGKPLNNLKIYIVDEDMHICPIGIKGELCVSGVGVGRGYLHNNELTEKVFLDNPFSKTDEKLYKTGDIARVLPSGVIEYIGRKDFQVKIRGYRIELNEIEHNILNINGVDDCVVTTKSELVNKKLCAYVLTQMKSITSSEIRNALNKKMPHYMVPSEIIILDEFPLSSNGKIDFNRLKLIDGKLNSNLNARFENETAKELYGIWCCVLEDSDISEHDVFFEIGGNSLLLMKLYHELENLYPGIFKMPDLFKLTTISQQAKYINSKKIETHNKVEVIKMLFDNNLFRSESDSLFLNASLKPIIDFELLGPIQKISKEENIKMQDFIIGLFVLLLRKVTLFNLIKINIAINNNSSLSHLMIDLKEIDNLSSLFDVIKNKVELNSMRSNVVFDEDKNSHRGVAILVYDKEQELQYDLDRFDISLGFSMDSNRLEFEMNYNAEKFERSKISAFFESYYDLVKNAVKKYKY